MFEDVYVESMYLGDQQLTDRRIDLRGFESSSVVLKILINDSGSEIEGIVRNDKGELADGASVVLVPESSHRSESDRFKAVTAGQDGRFTVRGIRPGEYKLFASDASSLANGGIPIS